MEKVKLNKNIDLENKNIIWISGRTGYGKTGLANYMINKFERKGRKTCKLSGNDFIYTLVENIKSYTLGEIIRDWTYYFRNYDLLVLDDIGYSLANKPITQGVVKEVVKGITDNNRTKVILITQKRARETGRLKFDSDQCLYLRLKSPTSDFKRKLVRKWLKDVQNVSIKDEEEIISITDDLFRLKGLCAKVKLSKEIQ